MNRRLRRIAFLGAAAWILLAPAYVQVFGGSSHRVRAWRMFHNRGVGICAAVYDHRGERIDRYALFALDRASAPDKFRRISNSDEARAMGRRICERLGSGADVRVQLRCGVARGMSTVLD